MLLEIRNWFQGIADWFQGIEDWLFSLNPLYLLGFIFLIAFILFIYVVIRIITDHHKHKLFRENLKVGQSVYLHGHKDEIFHSTIRKVKGEEIELLVTTTKKSLLPTD